MHLKQSICYHCWRYRYWALILLSAVITACDNTPRLSSLGDEAVILAFGDSLTAGTGATPDQSYPSQLQSIIARDVINAGVPGELSSSGLRRLPALLARHQPDLVIICHGGNDILRRRSHSKTRSNLQQMIDLSHDSGAEVVLIGVPEFGVFLSSAAFYTELAEDNNLPIENSVLGDVLGRTALKSDQIHPNSAGYRIIAENLAVLLQKSEAI